MHMQSLNRWFETLPGSMVIEMEQEQMASRLSRTTGQHLLQIGGPNNLSLVQDSPIRHKICLSLEKNTGPAITDIIGDCMDLSILPNSIDVVVLDHVLEFAANPQRVLAEIYQALAPQGFCFILGFNRWSLWNLLRWGKMEDLIFPENSHFRTVGNIKRMIKATGFQFLESKTFCFRPPVHHKKYATLLMGLELMGQIFLPGFGAIYMILAQKIVSGFTPLKTEWKVPKIHFSGFAETTSRRVSK